MKVRTRLLLFGVAAPAVGLIAALGSAGFLFRRHALASVDRELLARAAVESVGAFDHREPHLHLGRATFPPGFVDLDPRGALYNARGVAASDPPDQPAIALGPYGLTDAVRPALWTAADRRELAVSVRAANGEPFLLRLSCSLGPVKQTLTAYMRTTTALLAAVVLALSALWIWLARSISERLEHITARLPRGEALPAWQASGHHEKDEITALDRALAGAFARLRKAKDTQDEFIARAAHELKTPLGVMAAEMDLALSRERSRDTLQGALAGSREEVRRLAELSTRLLDLTSVQRVDLDLSAFDLVRTLYETLDHASPALEDAQVQIHVDAPEALLARGDALLVRQAFENLLSNALRYSPRGGQVSLQLRAEGTRAALSVRDQGPGVPEAERERIFEPFVRGREAQGSGTGLGLSIVRAVAVRLEGEVAALSSVRGAHFCFYLPLAVAEAGQAEG